MRESLEENMKQIEIPATLHSRCRMGMDIIKKEREERQMNKKNIIRMVLATAAVAGVCILTTGNTAIGNTKGFFKDVTRWDGAIVGTEYLQATEEIEMEVVNTTAEHDNTTICLEVTFVEKEQIPWKFIEEIALGSYKILDEEGKEVIVVENDATEGAKGTIVNGETQIVFEVEPLEENMQYTMVIQSMYGLKKADAPLDIKGNWELYLLEANKQ